MYRREERLDRYDSSRNDKMMDVLSREMQGRSTKAANVHPYQGRVAPILETSLRATSTHPTCFPSLKLSDTEEEQASSRTAASPSTGKV